MRRWSRWLASGLAVVMIAGTGTMAMADEQTSPGIIEIPSGLGNGTYEATVMVGENNSGEFSPYEMNLAVTTSMGAISGIQISKTQEEYQAYAEQARAAIEQQLVNATGSAISLDAVSGATYSANAVANAVQKALNSGKVTAPKISKITCTKKNLTVKWKASKGADAYVVYCNGKKVATTKKCTFVHKKANTNGKKYSYKIAASKDGQVRVTSKAEVGYFIAQPKINALLHGGKGTRSLVINWVENSKATGYELQCSTSKKFTGAKKKQIANNENMILAIIQNLSPGKDHYVRIRSYKQVGKKKFYSPWSSSKKQFVRYY